MPEQLVFAMEVFLNGLMAGVLYALVALGFVLIYKASGIFNYAQGVMALFAALTLVGVMEGQVPFAHLINAIFGTEIHHFGWHVPGDTGDPFHHGGDGRAGLDREYADLPASGQPGADHPLHGDDRPGLFPRRVRGHHVGGRHQEAGCGAAAGDQPVDRRDHVQHFRLRFLHRQSGYRGDGGGGAPGLRAGDLCTIYQAGPRDARRGG